MAKILFLLFLLIPIGEIYVLLEVGNLIGVLPTVAMIVFTAASGAALIRFQGLSTLARVRRSLDQHQLPAMELLEAACLLVAGALLLTPGFITDSFGFILLIPPLRRSLITTVLSKGVLRSGFANQQSQQDRASGRVIEGEYIKKDS